MTGNVIRTEVRRILADYIRTSPLSYKALADKFACSQSTIAGIAREHNIVRRPRLGLSTLGRLKESKD